MILLAYGTNWINTVISNKENNNKDY